MTQRNGLKTFSCCSQPLLEHWNADAGKRQPLEYKLKESRKGWEYSTGCSTVDMQTS